MPYYFFKKLPFVILILGSFILLSQNTLAKCGPGQIDINQASLNELQQLTGIGAVYAQRIIEARPFNSLDDLIKVKGIGEKTLDKIKSQGKACANLLSSPNNSGESPGSSASTSSPSEENTPHFSSLPQATPTPSQSANNAGQPGREKIKLNHAPKADAGDNIVTNVGSVIHFDGSNSQDEDGDKLTFLWNLGNGATENKDKFDYSYKNTGQYVVVLEVSDGHLLDTDTLVVSVYPAKVSISEFFPNPRGKDEEGEWIEIANSSGNLVDISGWQLQVSGNQTKQFIFPSNSFLLPHSFSVFDRKTTKLSLSNKQGSIRLLYPSGETADEVDYNNAREGMSAAKKGEDFFWTDLPTPGMKNVIFLKRNSIKSKKTSKTVSSTKLSLRKKQSCLPSPQKKIMSQGSLYEDDLIRKQHVVSFPSLSDLDKIVIIKSAFARNNESSELSEGQATMRQRTSFNQAIESSPKKAKLILALTIFASSFFFSLWGIVLKDKFFA